MRVKYTSRQKYDRKMSDEILNVHPMEKLHYSIDDVMELYGLDQWTIRMWVAWFGIPGHLSTADGDMLFTRPAVEQIGEICRLTKKKMKIKEIRKHLESGNITEAM